MTPDLSRGNERDAGLRNAKVRGDIGLLLTGCQPPADSEYIEGGELASVALPLGAAPLRAHVRIVVGDRSGKQVAWVDTRSVVAPVQDTERPRRASVNLPRNAMGFHGLAGQAERPIPSFEKGSRPYPAPSKLWAMGWNRPGLVDLFKKACDRLFVHGNTIPVGHVPESLARRRAHLFLPHQKEDTNVYR